MAKTKEARYSRYIFINNMIWYGVGFFDYLNTSAIYSSYVTKAFLEAFRHSLGFIFLPIYAINAAVYAVLGVIHLLYDRDKETKKIKKENIIRLIVSIFSALIVGVAVIGALAFAATMGIATTILFAANLAITGIYNYAGGCYHLYQFIKKGRLLKNNDLKPEARECIVKERQTHLGSTIGYFAVGFTITLSILAGSLALLGGFLPLAAFGIVGGLLGAGFCAYAIVDGIMRYKRENKSTQDQPLIPPDNTPKPNSTCNVFKKLCHNVKNHFISLATSFFTTNETSTSSTENRPRMEVKPLLQKPTPSSSSNVRRRSKS